MDYLYALAAVIAFYLGCLVMYIVLRLGFHAYFRAKRDYITDLTNNWKEDCDDGDEKDKV